MPPRLPSAAPRFSVFGARAEKREGTERFSILASRSADAESVGPRASHEKALSPRERELVILLAEGNSNKQVAAIVSLSVRTVEGYRARVMRKLDLHSFPELVRYAVRNGVLRPQAPGKPNPKNEGRRAPRTSAATPPGRARRYASNMSDEFNELQASFKAVQRRFAETKTSKEKRELIAIAQELILRAHLLMADWRGARFTGKAFR